MVTKDELLAKLRAAMAEERRLGVAPTPLSPDRLPPNWTLAIEVRLEDLARKFADELATARVG